MKALRHFFSFILFACLTVNADKFRMVDDNVEALQIRSDLLLSAEKEIRASYFIYGNDATSLTGLALLREVARRGRRVKLLLDATTIGPSRANLLKHLSDEGVDVRLFHPFKLSKPLQVLRRMHDKILIRDRDLLMTGGRNIEDSYFGLNTERNYIDRDVLTSGSPVEDAVEYFDALWKSDHVGLPKLHNVSEKKTRLAAKALDDAIALIEKDGLIRLKDPVDWLAAEEEVEKVNFIHDSLSSGKELQGDVARALGEHIARAKKEVLIETPYFVPTKTFYELVEQARERGVKVIVHTNSLLSTDGILPLGGYDRSKMKLLRYGVEIHEYKGPETIHAKSMVIDEEFAGIGSYNLDPRSKNLNTEVAVIVQDKKKALALKASILAHMENAHQIGPDGKPIGEDSRYPGATFKQVATMKCANFLSIIIRRQL
jgi:putative cardiolipin synthase